MLFIILTITIIVLGHLTENLHFFDNCKITRQLGEMCYMLDIHEDKVVLDNLRFLEIYFSKIVHMEHAEHLDVW